MTEMRYHNECELKEKRDGCACQKENKGIIDTLTKTNDSSHHSNTAKHF